jgi:hypothetical protein
MYAFFIFTSPNGNTFSLAQDSRKIIPTIRFNIRSYKCTFKQNLANSILYISSNTTRLQFTLKCYNWAQL